MNDRGRGRAVRGLKRPVLKPFWVFPQEEARILLYGIK